MEIIYQAVFEYNEDKKELFLTRTINSGKPDKGLVDLEQIQKLEKECSDFKWNRSEKQSREIGKKLFDIMNGDRQTLVRAIKEADDNGEILQLYVKTVGQTENLPFELVCDSDFLVPSRILLVRRVSEYGCKRKPEPENRALRVIFMACSPEHVTPVLEFEKEEQTIYEVTKDFPVEIDIEDTGSLEGIEECLAQNRYDIVHISGHADIDKNGTPIFIMEDEQGFSKKIRPDQLCEKLTLNMPRLVFLSGCRTGETPWAR